MKNHRNKVLGSQVREIVCVFNHFKSNNPDGDSLSKLKLKVSSTTDISV